MLNTLPDYLTAEQRAIITAPCDHAVITAVAGSGKTSTLAWRIRYLLQQGQDPARMLILMFNRSARVDFARKLAEVTRDTGLVLPEVRTYHSMGLRLYRRFISDGYLPAFSEAILSEQEISYQAWLLTRRLAPAELSDDIRRNKKDYVETAVGFIDRVKTSLMPAAETFEALGYADKHKYLVDLFHSFEQWRKSQGRISYADMLYEPVMAIHQNPPLQRLVTNKMDLILVDEYQDTNEIQHLLLRNIAGDRARVTVVGDPDQTIYEFRGAKPEFIISRFSEEFDSPQEHTLSYTFRYGHRVALLANHLISHNSGRKDILCRAHPSTPATDIQLHEHDDDADVVVRLIEPLSHEERTNTAILFRLWSQSVAIELRLLARQVPYRIDVGKGALFSREVRAVTALLQVFSGQLPLTPELDRLDIARQVLRFPHVGLKEPDLEQLAQALAREPQGWDQYILSLDYGSLAPMAAKKLQKLGQTLAKLTGHSAAAATLVKVYAEQTDLYDGLRSLALTHDIAEERTDTLNGFLVYLRTLDIGAADTLSHLQTLKAQAARDQHQGVLLSTIHRTKGLEWDQVIIPGVLEKYLPGSPRQTDNLRAFIESERRLLYVAMTRARDRLHLITRAPGQRPHLEGELAPSRFINELCFSLSDQLGSWLDQPATETDNRSLSVSCPITAIGARYAQQEDIALATTAATSTTNTTGPIWAQAQLVHTIFGNGSVTGEDESAFEVRFDNGKMLNFSKKSAHLYFSLPKG